jgi:uncharacterized membrane protein
MKKWLLWTSLGALVVAILVHIITVIAVPRIIMKVAFARIPTNQLQKRSKVTAHNREVVRPSPDLVYSGVSYDVSKGPIRLTAKVPTDTYWSVSCFQDNTDNFFVVNDRQVKSNPVEIILVRQGMQVPEAGNAHIVVSPTNSGILLVRHLLVSDDNYQELLNIQKQSSLKVGNASDALTTPAKGRGKSGLEGAGT